MTLPLNPTKLSAPVATWMGVIGIAKTGGVIFNHLSSPDGVNDVAKVHEGESLDSCHGHAAPGCIYHYHEFSKAHACAFDKTWNECEWIGTMIDGFKLYSHCKASSGTFLRSCWKLKSGKTDAGSTSSFEHVSGSDCELDQANGYDFTGKGIKDASGNTITGYAYVATDTYPYVMPYLYGKHDCSTVKQGTIDATKKCFIPSGSSSCRTVPSSLTVSNANSYTATGGSMGSGSQYGISAYRMVIASLVFVMAYNLRQ